MSTQTLSRITMETMANYRTAATQVVAATGAGSRRLVRLVDGTVQQQVLPRATRVVPQVAERLDAVRGRVSQFVEQGIDQAQQRAEAGIARGSDFAVAQVARWADRAAELRQPMISSSLDAAASIGLPAAKMGLVLSGRLAEGATQIADAVGAHPVQKAVRKARKAGASVKAKTRTVARAGRKAAAGASAKVSKAPAVKRARRAVKKAAAA